MNYSYHNAHNVFHRNRPCNRIAVIGKRKNYLALKDKVFSGIDWQVLVFCDSVMDLRCVKFERFMVVGELTEHHKDLIHYAETATYRESDESTDESPDEVESDDDDLPEDGYY